MKNKDDSMSWFPLYADKWIFGSTRIELDPDERAVWIDLLALATKDNGYVRANEETPYPLQQLAGLFCVPIELLDRTIKKCLSENINKIERLDNGTLYIINWEEYQFTDRYKRKLKSSSALTEQQGRKPERQGRKPERQGRKTAPIEYNIIGKNIIEYLNSRTGKTFKHTTAKTEKLIRARLNEGFTLEDFKTVIDKKVTGWKDKKWQDNRTDEGRMIHGNDYLRPSTLFSGSFENYLNETKQESKKTTFQSMDEVKAKIGANR